MIKDLQELFAIVVSIPKKAVSRVGGMIWKGYRMCFYIYSVENFHGKELKLKQRKRNIAISYKSRKKLILIY